MKSHYYTGGDLDLNNAKATRVHRSVSEKGVSIGINETRLDLPLASISSIGMDIALIFILMRSVKSVLSRIFCLGGNL